MFKNPVFQYSVAGALLVIAYFGVFYAMDKALFINPGVQWGSLIFYAGAMYGAARADMRQNGRMRDFRTLLRPPFIVFLLINLGYWLFYYGLHLADPALVQMETAARIAHLRQQLSGGLGDPQQANQMREQLQALENAPSVMALGPVILRMAVGSLGGFVLAAGVVVMARQGKGGT